MSLKSSFLIKVWPFLIVFSYGLKWSGKRLNLIHEGFNFLKNYKSKRYSFVQEYVSYVFELAVHYLRNTEGNQLGAVVRLCRPTSFLASGWKSGVLFSSRTQWAGLNLYRLILTLSPLLIFISTQSTFLGDLYCTKLHFGAWSLITCIFLLSGMVFHQ
jgi:hypothetical protein